MPTPRRLARSSLMLLIGLQLLLTLTVALGTWAGSQRLRRLTLENTLNDALTQAHNLEDSLSQSFQLLHMHLQSLAMDQPGLADHLERTELLRLQRSALTGETTGPADAAQPLHTALLQIQQKLPWVRSLSILNADNRVVLSTRGANLGHAPALEPLLPQVQTQTPGVLRFGHPWRGRDFADGSPWPDQPLPASITDPGFIPITLVLPEAPRFTLLAAVSSDFFINRIHAAQKPGHLHHDIHADDGTLLFSSSETAQPGTRLPAQALAQILERQVGTAEWPSADGGDTLLAGFRTSRSYPWFVQAQAVRSEVLAPWQRQTRQTALVAGLSVAALLLVTGLMTRRVQQTLTKEEQHLKDQHLAAQVFAHSNDLIAITDPQGNTVSVNPAFEKGTGFSAQEVRGRKPGEWSQDQPSALNFPAVLAAMGSADSWQGEITDRRKDGSPLPGWLSINAIRDSQGRVVYYASILHDLTRIRADEAAIRKLSQAVEQSPASIIITSTVPAIEYANPQFFRSTGYSPEEILGANPRILQSGQTPAATYRAMWAALLSGQVWQGEFINRRKDGSFYTEGVTIAPLTDAQGSTTHYLGIKQDITAQKEAEKALHLAASVIAQTNEAVMVCDAEQRIVDVNPAFTRLTGHAREAVLGSKPSVLSAGRRNRQQYEEIWQTLKTRGHWQGELWNRRADGSLYAVAATLNAIRDADGQITHYIDVFTDITDRKQQQEHLESLAHFDPLTHLPNRTLLGDRLTQALAHAQRKQNWLAVCFIDLDGFKAVNDTHGHEAGDDLLTIVARRLVEGIRAEDTAARLGGDEFVVLLGGVTREAECAETVARLLQSVRQTITVNGHQVQVGASMGIAIYPRDGNDAETLLRHADQAMYQAKQSGRNRWVFYAQGMTEQRPPSSKPPAAPSVADAGLQEQG